MKSIALMSILLAAALASGGFALPTTEECAVAFEELGKEAVRGALTPCAFSDSKKCCEDLEALMGLNDDAPAGGCLCDQEVLDELVLAVEANPAARFLNFTGEALISRLKDCKVAHVGSGACEE